MRWKLLSSAITTSLLVRSSAITLEMLRVPPRSSPPPGKGAGAPAATAPPAPGATPPMLGRRPVRPPPAAAGACPNTWFTFSARSRAEAYFTWMKRISSPEPGRSSVSSIRSRRRTLRPRSVRMSTSGGIAWRSAPWGEMKLERTPRKRSASA